MWAIAFLLHGATAASCSTFRYSRVTRRGLEEHSACPSRRGRGSGGLRDPVEAAQFRRLDVEDETRAGAELGRSARSAWTHVRTLRFLVSRLQPARFRSV